ncbi:MAG: rRNA maturation RNase YbeY [Bacteroidales bacterium]|nr:rRNA maturation RNase YbeY [Bacteroidales bacterium]
MAIRFSCQTVNFELFEAEKVKRWVSEVVVRRGKQIGNINYLFCDDEYLLGVNRQYLDHDTYTDIITFDYVAGGLISGDIMISVDRVGENAAKFGVPFEQELHRVVIHGVLHLLGQGDKSDTEATEMRRQEEEALSLWNEMFHVQREG